MWRLLAVAALGLTACEGGGDPVEAALREASAARHAAATPETPLGSPPTNDADVALTTRLIEAERRALAAAEVVAVRAEDPELRRLADLSSTAHRERIRALEAWTPGA